LFHEEYWQLIHQKEKAKLQLLQNPRQINGDKLNNVKSQNGQNFQQKRNIWKTKLMSLKQTVKYRNIRLGLRDKWISEGLPIYNLVKNLRIHRTFWTGGNMNLVSYRIKDARQTQIHNSWAISTWA
jgi:hypothetical protein